SFGKYVILDNHDYIAITQDMIDFWKDAAVHYANNPAVLFGLLNEPHDVSWDVWLNGNNSNYFGHQQLVNTIRALGANNIIVAGGLEYGYTLDGIAANNFSHILVDTPQGHGIMYDSHAYPWKDSKGFPTSATKVLCMADKAPILIGEFGIEEEGANGGGDANKTSTVLQKPWYIQDILDWMELHDFNFTAWNFHPSSAPRMVLNDSNWTARQNVTPNQYFGQQVYARLKSYPDSNSHLNPIPARPANGN
ncbi:MAG: glycoside hydrolase family 5 protein, partial [Treponema sp.]|nr:glycoside hydrolase family 5 protein [Treponema sp.]